MPSHFTTSSLTFDLREYRRNRTVQRFIAQSWILANWDRVQAMLLAELKLTMEQDNLRGIPDAVLVQARLSAQKRRRNMRPERRRAAPRAEEGPILENAPPRRPEAGAVVQEPAHTFIIAPAIQVVLARNA